MMKYQSLKAFVEYLDIVTRVDRTTYFRCRKVKDIEALAKGLASLFPGKVRMFLHTGNPLLPEEEDQIKEPLLAGETVLFIYPGETGYPLRLAQKWDRFQVEITPGMDKPGFLAVVQVFDDEEAIPYEGSTRWIFEEEVEGIEALGKNLYGEVVRLKGD